MSFQICVAQHNLVVGDLPGNARQIIDAAHAAHARGARLLLTPELSLGGYIAEDLFLRPAFVAACDDALNQVARETAGLGPVSPVRNRNPRRPRRASSSARLPSVSTATAATQCSTRPGPGATASSRRSARRATSGSSGRRRT